MADDLHNPIAEVEEVADAVADAAPSASADDNRVDQDELILSDHEAQQLRGYDPARLNHCERCGYDWPTASGRMHPPKACARCRSAYWQTLPENPDRSNTPNDRRWDTKVSRTKERRKQRLIRKLLEIIAELGPEAILATQSRPEMKDFLELAVERARLAATANATAAAAAAAPDAGRIPRPPRPAIPPPPGMVSR